MKFVSDSVTSDHRFQGYFGCMFRTTVCEINNNHDRNIVVFV